MSANIREDFTFREGPAWDAICIEHKWSARTKIKLDAIKAAREHDARFHSSILERQVRGAEQWDGLVTRVQRFLDRNYPHNDCIDADCPGNQPEAEELVRIMFQL